MSTQNLLTFLLQGNQLKRTARTGWVQRGVPQAENVATHSYGVVFIALTLAELVEVPLDCYKVLAMATLHDLPEALTTDIPTPAWRHLPPGIKVGVERQAMTTMMADMPFAERFMHLWEELHTQTTAEARLVEDADKLEMFIQAVVYEEQTGNRQLAEFWSRPHTFHYPQAQALYEALSQRRLSPSP
jgi:putative hydrolase of HD superfamily